MKFKRVVIGRAGQRDRIRTARRAAKLSQAALASRVGVTPGAVAHWERPGGARPGIDRLAAVAAAVNVSFDWLATGNGIRRGKPSGEAVSAVALDTFAQNLEEETLLACFRRLPNRIRPLLINLLRALIRR